MKTNGAWGKVYSHISTHPAVLKIMNVEVPRISDSLYKAVARFNWTSWRMHQVWTRPYFWFVSVVNLLWTVIIFPIRNWKMNINIPCLREEVGEYLFFPLTHSAAVNHIHVLIVHCPLFLHLCSVLLHQGAFFRCVVPLKALVPLLYIFMTD